ncbi:MAG TPA: GNAT family N-acetyltransferase [Thermomicrobiales bacterium]|nr:GNAT family N-acetyltransferase [Thermomicrobiales bacterium]
MERERLVVPPLRDGSLVELIPCDPARHGPFIRDLSRQNFAGLMERTVGWDEAHNQQEPQIPERYRMVLAQGEPIGFFAVRAEEDALYLQTIQLVPEHRRQGIGTALLRHIEALAQTQGCRAVRLRVFKENPALDWYQRNGYQVVTDEPYSLMMEKTV